MCTVTHGVHQGSLLCRVQAQAQTKNLFPSREGDNRIEAMCGCTHVCAYMDSRFKYVRLGQQGDHLGEGQQERQDREVREGEMTRGPWFTCVYMPRTN